MCYFTNWSLHRTGAAFRLTDIDTSLCTHLVYAFAKIDLKKHTLLWTDPTDDNGLGDKKGDYYDFVGLKKSAPSIKTMLSVGGQTLSDSFETLVANTALRKLFAGNCVVFLRDRNFDGLDIDWEFPKEAMKDLFTELLKVSNPNKT